MSSLQRPGYGNQGEAAVHPSVAAAGIQRSPLNLRSPSSMLDPALLRAARHIYRTYYEVRPIPVLLPHESFIPFTQLVPGLH